MVQYALRWQSQKLQIFQKLEYLPVQLCIVSRFPVWRCLSSYAQITLFFLNDICLETKVALIDMKCTEIQRIFASLCWLHAEVKTSATMPDEKVLRVFGDLAWAESLLSEHVIANCVDTENLLALWVEAFWTCPEIEVPLSLIKCSSIDRRHRRSWLLTIYGLQSAKLVSWEPVWPLKPEVSMLILLGWSNGINESNESWNERAIEVQENNSLLLSANFHPPQWDAIEHFNIQNPLGANCIFCLLQHGNAITNDKSGAKLLIFHFCNLSHKAWIFSCSSTTFVKRFTSVDIYHVSGFTRPDQTRNANSTTQNSRMLVQLIHFSVDWWPKRWPARILTINGELFLGLVSAKGNLMQSSFS